MISKPVIYIISTLILILLFLTHHSVQTSRDHAEGDAYGPPVNLANLEYSSVKESSGVASSERNRGIFWTHNDSGDGPFIYAFDRKGKHRGVWKVAGARAQDWEDMALGPGPARGRSYIYAGDIGDNSKRRDHIVVYRVAEPQITAKDSSSTVKNPRDTEPAEAIRLKYPDGKHDAEALMVHPSTGDLYIVTKAMGAAAGVYKLKSPYRGSDVSVLTKVGEVEFPNAMRGFITGGDISRDGRRVVLCDYLGACEIALPGGRGVAFDEVWKQTPAPVGLGARRQGEAICYRADGQALIATSEGSPCPLIEVPRRARER
jgi:hypothetical protein